MSNESTGSANGRLVNQGFTFWYLATADDISLLSQQTNYAALCTSFISQAGPFFRGGKNVTTEIQNILTALSQSVPMTATSAAAYFSGITAGYWSKCVVDWMAGYQAITSYKFV